MRAQSASALSLINLRVLGKRISGGGLELVPITYPNNFVRYSVSIPSHTPSSLSSSERS